MRNFRGWNLAALLVTLGPLTGCALAIPRSYTSKDEVTLPQAMRDLSCGLATLRNEQSRLNVNTGTFVDQIDVTLNLKASATGSSTLVVDAKPALPPTIGTLGVNYTDKTDLIGSRDNTIKITLKSLHTAPLNDAGKAAAKRRNLPFDLGPGPLAAVPDPCNPPQYSARLLAGATKINDPTEN